MEATKKKLTKANTCLYTGEEIIAGDGWSILDQEMSDAEDRRIEDFNFLPQAAREAEMLECLVLCRNSY